MRGEEDKEKKNKIQCGKSVRFEWVYDFIENYLKR